MVKEQLKKLDKWQRRLAHDMDKWAVQVDKFDHREELLRGSRSVKACCENDTKKDTPHVRNIVAELIESQVDTAIPMPKVKARKAENEHLAKIIEDMLMNELDRMPMEVLNDMMERTVPSQGGSFFWLEWDNTLRSHDAIGDLTIQTLHPKQIVPQDGVVTGIEDMDYIIVKVPQTKEYIKKAYNVDVRDESEEEPEVRAFEDVSPASGMVTQYIAYYRNDSGGIGVFSWVNDTVLEDYEDYQARQLKRCKKCGALETDAVSMDAPSLDGEKPTGDGEALPEWMEGAEGDAPARSGKHAARCKYCGSTKFEQKQESFETIMLPMDSGVLDPTGKPIMKTVPVQVPYYKPDIYPIIMQKNVSMFGQLLGDSDVDKIEDMQNTLNRMSAKQLDMMLKAGSFATLPASSKVMTDNAEMKYIRIKDPVEKQLIDVFTMMPEPEYLNNIVNMQSYVYEQARQAIGITDSFQGRQDPTATSGKAKEFAAQQSAGRLESKRVMKEAAYQQLYEAIFKFKLAYADEPRNLVMKDARGENIYSTFNRYDFLKQDKDGSFYWEDDFIFSVDSSTPLAKDREAMWQEMRMNLQTGAFGDPTNFNTLILFWQQMEDLHYPGAAFIKQNLETAKAEMEAQQAQQMLAQQQAQMQQAEVAKVQAEADAVKNIVSEVQKNGNKKAEEKNTDQ